MKIRYWLLAMSFFFLSCGRVADDVAANYGIRKCEEKIRIPAVSITDASRFPHRGVMMDVGRNFLPKEEVQKFITVGTKRLTYDFTLTEGTRFPASLSFAETEAAFVRLELLSGGLCPKGYFHEGLQSELAIDEIEIY